MATHDAPSVEGFVPFFRRYAQTWVHAVAAAGMTAFGTLAVFHRGFIILALASYVLPPIVLYLRGASADRTDSETATDRADAVATDDRPTEAEAAPLERPADETRPEPEHAGTWTLVDAPTEATLRDVCVTATGAVHAVGEDGLVLAGAAPDGAAREWSIALEDGPAAAGEDLHGVDATADGEAVWVAGDSGAVGRLEVTTGRHTDYTAPAGITDNWLGVAVGGPAGDETILLINGSGAVLRGRYRDGELSWADPITPGSGSSLSGVALADASVGYCCDTNDGVFETTDGGDSFSRVGLGDASGTLENLATLGEGDCFVSADDGVVHRYDGSTWTPERVGEEAICGIARREVETIACDADGVIHERTAVAEWNRADTIAPEPLLAVSVDGDGHRAVAVGEEGTVVERW
ncbi:WD40/YVTN/BNR-like repeat-containing protein [Haloarchaeobius amylolyticus]|uniref:WD40/YVTN/BNR-like repeat-containing protein n=1 Tax=Haloarchaeobius amylolyticus TaxID=1198296 RepID=A0ABD6BEY9_9EURY